MSGLQPTDSRNCVGVYSASDGESSDDEDEEALLVEKRRETFLRESRFCMCLSTLDEWVKCKALQYVYVAGQT